MIGDFRHSVTRAASFLAVSLFLIPCLAAAQGVDMPAPSASQAHAKSKTSKRPKKIKQAAEPCDAEFARENQELGDLNQYELQNCSLADYCSQQEKCAWYKTSQDYESDLSQIAARCSKLPGQEQLVQKYSTLAQQISSGVERCTTGDWADPGGSQQATLDVRAHALRERVHEARAHGVSMTRFATPPRAGAAHVSFTRKR